MWIKYNSREEEINQFGKIMSFGSMAFLLKVGPFQL
jgi:hypothetical protein